MAWRCFKKALNMSLNMNFCLQHQCIVTFEGQGNKIRQATSD